MSGREWKPGDVTMVAHPSGGERRATYRPSGTDDGAPVWDYYNSGGVGRVDSWPARPLVVIDPEDREQVGKVLAHYWHSDDPYNEDQYPEYLTDLQAALRSLIEPPPEPTDPTVRVGDRRENTWRLLADGDWVCTSGPDIGEYLGWERLASERGPLEVTTP